VEVALYALAQDLDRARLGEARRALDEQMAVAEQRQKHPVDEMRLADDALADMRLEFPEMFAVRQFRSR
jgi:hypothetical protein